MDDWFANAEKIIVPKGDHVDKDHLVEINALSDDNSKMIDVEESDDSKTPKEEPDMEVHGEVTGADPVKVSIQSV